MRKNCIRIEIGEEELKAIFEELDEAQEKIYECYEKLINLGVVTIRKRSSEETDSLGD